jgi:hypothetical protein
LTTTRKDPPYSAYFSAGLAFRVRKLCQAKRYNALRPGLDAWQQTNLTTACLTRLAIPEAIKNRRAVVLWQQTNEEDVQDRNWLAYKILSDVFDQLLHLMTFRTSI